MQVAVIGAGSVGQALAGGWALSGHRVSFGLRNGGKPEARSFAQARGIAIADPASAAAAAEVVVIAVPWAAAQETAAALGDLGQRVVVDCTNPLVRGAGGIGVDPAVPSGGAAVAGWLRGGRLVKSLNHTGANVMAAARGYHPAPVMFLAGEDPAAKELVAGLLRDLGFAPQDAGGLAQAGLLESLALLWIRQAMMMGQGRDWAFGISRMGA